MAATKALNAMLSATDRLAAELRDRAAERAGPLHELSVAWLTSVEAIAQFQEKAGKQQTHMLVGLALMFTAAVAETALLEKTIAEIEAEESGDPGPDAAGRPGPDDPPAADPGPDL